MELRPCYMPIGSNNSALQHNMYLNCHTYYSLRYGTFSPEALCELAREHGVQTLALTDINNTSACMDFIKIAPKYGIKPLVGVDFRNGVQQQYVVLARNNKGFRQLNIHLSQYLHQQERFPSRAPLLPDCYVVYPWERLEGEVTLRENEFIGVSVENLGNFRFSRYCKLLDKQVLLQPVSFRNKRDFNAHRLLRCIGNNTLLSKLPVAQQGSLSHRMQPEEILEQEFEDFPQLLKNTRAIMRECQVSFGFGKQRINQNLQVFSTSPEEDARMLRKLCEERLPGRYPELTDKIRMRVEKELQAIINLGFVSYFLINLDIVEYARSRNYPFIGRGSGANSVVAYVLGITNVDPIELDLYFERFINAHRNSPPDFDLDFSWKDREDVTAYIFKKYENTALLAAYVTFKRRAVMRELGKVFGLPKENIDKLSAGWYTPGDLDEVERLVLRYSKLIEGFPNYLSVHAGGIMILERPVHDFSATFLPPKGFRTAQIDMNISEEVGIFKFDILGQRGLSKIVDAVDLVRENQPDAQIEDLDRVEVFKRDPEINKMLSKGDCMGVFYVESPAMRGLLTKLQTSTYLELVAASSIIRPGVSSGGMKEEYIKRHRDPSRRQQAHPVLYEILKETYGVMVYQEDVLKVAHYFAGLSLEEADVLRRGMSGKKTAKGQMEAIEAKFRRNCREKGYDKQLIDEVWEQIAAFAGYAFPKGHSASYAVESYQSLYLKRYFPLEFMVAALNNGGGFYDVETYIQEIRRCGGRVHPPCVNRSDHPTSIRGKDIYLGLGYLKELEVDCIRRIIENRQFFGPFRSLDDFLDRVPVSMDQLAILLKVNAFRFTGEDKHHLLWKAHFKLNRLKGKLQQPRLFAFPQREFELPALMQSRLIDAYDQLEVLGFNLYNHFELLKHPMEPAVKASQLAGYVGKKIYIYGDLIVTRRVRTSNNKYICFSTFYDSELTVFDTVQFPTEAERYPVRSKGIYLCCATVIEEWGYISLQVHWLQRQETAPDPRSETSSAISISSLRHRGRRHTSRSPS